MNRKFALIVSAVFLQLVTLSSADARRPSRPPAPEPTLIIDKNLGSESLQPVQTKGPDGEYYFPNKRKVIDYYLQLNRKLVKRNPIADAKRAYDSGQYFIIPEQFDFIPEVPALIKFQKHLTAYKKYSGSSPTVGFKYIQGTRSLELWYHRSVERNSRVLLLYGQSMIRYAYYWNRTMHHLLNAHHEKT